MASPPPSPPPASPPRVAVAARPPPPPRLADRVREAVEEALFALRRFVRDNWDDFRRRDRYFQWKAAIVAAWTVTSLISIRVAMAGPDDPSANGLGAYAAVTHTTMSWGLLVHNRSDDTWSDVRIVLDGGWVHERARIGPDEKVVLSPAQFSRGGEKAPLDLAIRGVRVETADGDATPRLVHGN